MPNIIVKTMNVEEAADLMRQAGIRTSAERVRMGIQQGVYPWGDAVKMGTMSHIVYTKLFWKWMEERGECVSDGGVSVGGQPE